MRTGILMILLVIVIVVVMNSVIISTTVLMIIIKNQDYKTKLIYVFIIRIIFAIIMAISIYSQRGDSLKADFSQKNDLPCQGTSSITHGSFAGPQRCSKCPKNQAAKHGAQRRLFERFDLKIKFSPNPGTGSVQGTQIVL